MLSRGRPHHFLYLGQPTHARLAMKPPLSMHHIGPTPSSVQTSFMGEPEANASARREIEQQSCSLVATVHYNHCNDLDSTRDSRVKGPSAWRTSEKLSGFGSTLLCTLGKETSLLMCPSPALQVGHHFWMKLKVHPDIEIRREIEHRQHVLAPCLPAHARSFILMTGTI